MATVASVLRESRQRINARRPRIYGVPNVVLQSQAELLRSVMFKRRGGNEAFHPLDEEELAVLDHVVRGYMRSGTLLAGNESFWQNPTRSFATICCAASGASALKNFGTRPRSSRRRSSCRRTRSSTSGMPIPFSSCRGARDWLSPKRPGTAVLPNSTITAHAATRDAQDRGLFR